MQQKGTGAIPAYRGRLQRYQKGSGIFSSIAKLTGKILKDTVPKIGKQILQDSGPQIVADTLKLGQDVITGKKTAKQAASQALKKNKNIILKSAGKSIKRSFKGGRREKTRGGTAKSKMVMQVFTWNTSPNTRFFMN